MPQNPNESVERPQDRQPEARPDMERERDEPRQDDVKGLDGDEDFDQDVDPDSAKSENDRDDTLTD